MHLCLLTSSFPSAPDDLALPFLPGFVGAVEARGWRVTVVAPDRRGADASPTGRVLWFGWLGGRRPVVSLSAARPADLVVAAHLVAAWTATVALLHARDPVDHLLAAFALPAGLVASLVARTAALPYTVWALGSDVQVWGRRAATRRLVARVLRGASHRFADGYGLADEVAGLAGRPCGFLPSARRLPAPASVPIRRDRRNLLYLGRLEPVKGVDVLLAAFDRVAPGHPDLDLHVVGDGSLAACVASAARGRLAGRLWQHPPAGPGAVAGYLAAADVLVLPSRAESIPTLLLEAASLGLPTIASAVGDVPRVVRDFGLGQVVPAGDPVALGDAIARWAARPPERLPSDAVARVAAAFSPDAAAEALLAALGRP